MKIEVNGWRGYLNRGLAPRELEATLLAAGEMTVKQIARQMNISPDTAKNRLDGAKFKLESRTIRGLVLKAYRQGIIAPLVLALLVGGGHQQNPAPRRPAAPRNTYQLRITRKAEDMPIAA